MAKRKPSEEDVKTKVSTEELEKIEKIVKKKKSKSGIPTALSILPLRDIVIFPNMIFPVLIGRSSSLSAISEAQDRDKFIFVSAQKDPAKEELEIEDLYEYGTVAKILQIIRLPNNLLKVLLEGFFQAKKIVWENSHTIFYRPNIFGWVFGWELSQIPAFLSKYSQSKCFKIRVPLSFCMSGVIPTQQ